MESNRMEAFSDGVLAIIITITVLGMEQPQGTDINSLISIIPQILIYAMSFLYVGAYWINHHHLVQTVKYVNGQILWANMFFLFWISIIPFMTNWVSKYPNEWVPTFGYGVVLILTAIGFSVLQQAILREETSNDILKKSVKSGRYKGAVTGILNVIALVICSKAVHMSQIIYALLLILWLVPDKIISEHMNSVDEE